MQLCRKESKCTAGRGSMTDRCGVDTGSADLCSVGGENTIKI